MLIRYGKPSQALMNHKISFFEENQALVRRNRELAALYMSQPPRLRCKCCDSDVGPSDFRKDKIPYSFCTVCGHLNGLFEDTPEFCASVYAGAGGADYAKVYSTESNDAYSRRVADIYIPKASFLRDSLLDQGLNFADLSYADLGAGSGYFVEAMRQSGASHIVGFEASPIQVALADRMIGPGRVIGHDLTDLPEKILSLNAEVVSMIGVLEHVEDPRAVLRAIQRNREIRFLYVSLPLVSPSVFVEMVFPDVFNRHLSGGHTHLFTDESISYLCTEFGMDRISEWWFGTDIFDLFRSVMVQMGSYEFSPEMQERWRSLMEPVLDELQVVLDQRRSSSEVHLLMSINDHNS